jgi:Ca2+-binding RTX toxin-like protein
VHGDDGADQIIGSAAIDELHGDAGNDTISGGVGDDKLYGEDGNDSLDGGAGADRLEGGSGNNTLVGGDGDDTIVSTGLHDIIDGGDGFDSLTFDRSSSSTGLSVAIDTNTITISGEATVLNVELLNFIGSAGDDVVQINDRSRVAGQIAGGAGVDRLVIDLSDQTAEGFLLNANDQAPGSGQFNYPTMSMVFSGFEAFTVQGGTARDHLTGGSGDDIFYGNGGSDVLDGYSGDDQLYGGDGDDFLSGGTGHNIMSGGDGNDRIQSFGIGDVVDGGAGTDIFVFYYDPTITTNIVFSSAGFASSAGGTLSNGTIVRNVESLSLQTGSGNDTVTIADLGSSSSSDVVAGAGDDLLIVDFSGSVDPISFNAAYFAPGFGAVTVGSSPWLNLTFRDFERVNVTGGAATDSLQGGAGADFLSGGGSADGLIGGGGDDTLIGGSGADWIEGDDGVDTASYVTSLAGVTIDLAIMGPQVGGDAQGDFLVGIENVVGSAFADTLSGDAGVNTLTGNAGNDTLIGALSDDTLNGGAGIDTATYASASTSDSWHRNLDGSWTVTAGAEGTDTLTGVEFAHFTDRDVFLARAAETFSGDGASDIFLRSSSSGALALWFLNGASITGAAPGSIAASFSTLGYGDLNGDGRDDILWRDTSGALSLWEMNGAAHTAVSLGNVSTAWNVAGVGDLNGDGVDDVLWRNGAGDMSLWFMDANAGHTGASLGNVSPDWVIEAFGDFNGDGRQDFLWRNTVSGDMSLWFMNGTAVTGGQFAHVGQPWVVEGTGDFNGDGRDDVLWRNSTTGDMSIWMMNGQTLVSQPGYSVGPSWHIAAIGDYNGDGRDDLIWWNDNGTLVEWLMNGGAITSTFSPGSLDHDWIINPGG